MDPAKLGDDVFLFVRFLIQLLESIDEPLIFSVNIPLVIGTSLGIVRRHLNNPGILIGNLGVGILNGLSHEGNVCCFIGAATRNIKEV